MHLFERWRLLRRTRERHRADPSDVAGDRGETAALQAIDRLARGTFSARFPALRVPKSRDRGKFEIDLLLVSRHALVAVEVKHWGGVIEDLGGGAWRQVAGSGEFRQHEDPLRENRNKLEELRAYLEQNGAPVSRDRAHALVVFTHERSDLSKQLRAEPSVVTLEDLARRLTPLLAPQRHSWFSTLMERLARKRVAPIGDLERIVRNLERLPTWDRVHLHGGRVHKGDLQGKGILLENSGTVTRRETTDVQLRLPRAWWQIGRTPAALWRDRSGQRHRRALALPQQVALKLAGRNEKIELTLEQVTRIEFGWRDESYYDPEKPALAEYRLGRRFTGRISGVTGFGVFVDLDGYRDGLVHAAALRRHGKTPHQYALGEALHVTVQGTRIRKGKETIDLDLA